MREIIPDLLWIGNALDVRDVHRIVNQGISVVIDLAMEEPSIQYPREIIYCRIPLVDGNGNSVAALWGAISAAATFIRAETTLIVACSAGMSRSPAVVAAALTQVQGLSLDNAIQRVAGSGPTDVSPILWQQIQAACTTPMCDGSQTVFLTAAINTFQANKRLADRAIEQTADKMMHLPLDENTNSIVVIMKHIAGNLQSRWTDFLTTDGEKPNRNRDDEFVDSFQSRQELLAYWERGWQCLFSSLRALTADDCSRTVLIRGEPHSVPLAIERSLGHTCYHIGQIVQLARHHADEHWKTLTIPRGGSAQFNQQMREADTTKADDST